ncbi:MFS transporter [Lactobacillus sp. ESL0679]|uniref:MFS transporter n=1 Tax=unclassified Lactobacillus TaxID=2620435 RepID=UPI0023F8BAB8|nr:MULTISPECIES: MFS transporter [unclassified Lactobacillus]MDF7682266.1 MFS transporter [Lactobacillus sp. ESL0679]WEV36824.1 MFS transporter [Lactobacillus sp. ESL0677]
MENERSMPALSSYRWVILAVLSLMSMTSSYVQFQVSALATRIMPVLHITPTQFSSLLMAPMLVAVFLSIPGGTLGDKFGPKKVVASGFIISIIGAFGRLVANNFATMMIALLMFGVYMALGNANSTKIIGTWFKQDTGIAMGIWFGCGTIGTTLSQLTGVLFKTVQAAYMFSSCVLVVVACFWVLLIRNAPKGEAIPKREPVTKYFGVAARSKRVWMLCICGGIVSAASMSFIGTLPQILINSKGINPAVAGVMTSCASMGALVGSMVGPAIIKKLNNARPFMLFAVILSGIMIFMNTKLTGGALMMCNLALGGLFGSMTGPVLKGMTIQLPEIGPKYAGSAGGIGGTVSMLLSYVVPVMISAIAGHNPVMTIGLQALLHVSAVIFILMLPDANHVK